MTARPLFTAFVFAVAAAGCGGDSVEGKADLGGVGTTVTTTTADLDGDGDGYPASEDCDDTDASVSPEGVEVCDGIDNDCDGEIDPPSALDAQTFFTDADGDGFGDAASPFDACEPGPEGAENDLDCNDGDALISPDALEVCDEVDNDCDGLVDDADDSLDRTTGGVYYADEDGDGYGDPDNEAFFCEAAMGFVEDNTDCNDDFDTAYPGTNEICDDLDNDCDGLIDDEDDEVDLSTQRSFYPDLDGDGFGVPDDAIEGCSLPSGYSTEATDCNDEDSAINPDATEVCDELDVDEDCDLLSDDDDPSVDATTATAYYADADTDSFGDRSDPGTLYCDDPGDGSVTNADDCDDGASSVNPDATEVCDEGDVDEDCSGTADDADAGVDPSTRTDWYTDGDSDGFGDRSGTATSLCNQPSGTVADNTDCDDGAVAVNPDADEVCDDLDNDCDDLVDDDDDSLDATTATAWYADGDSDGYGHLSDSVTACDAPGDYVADNTDCNDGNASVNPGETEVCDDADTDEDCSGSADDSDAGVDSSTFTDWYPDSDTDTYGDATASATAQCDAPSGSVDNALDCDDSESAINPDATEICDSVDNDCDTDIDDDDASLDTTTTTAWAPDSDTDGYGDDDGVVELCAAPSGYTSTLGDCDDSDGDINPDAQEVCDAADTDEDCDGLVDDADDSVDLSTTAGLFYPDSDGDGYGDDGATAEPYCDSPGSEYVTDNTDCDDDDEKVNPGEVEVCNEVDDDCDASTSSAGMAYWMPDSGAAVDYTSTLAVGTSGSPAVVSWGTDGTLNLCQGTWYVDATVAGATLTINGIDGSGAVVLDGDFSNRMLDIESGSNVTLSGLTFSSGSTSGDGGAVRVEDAELQGSDLVFDSNASDGYGGGLFALASTVDLADCVFEDNESEAGGGLLMEDSSDLTVERCRFTDNVSEFGGGLNIYDGSTMTLSDGTFSGNEAGSYGGGIRCFAGTSISVSDTSFTGEFAGEDGGAVELVSCGSTFTNVTVTSSTAGDSGGAFWTSSDITLDNVSVDGAVAEAGGAVYLSYGAGDVAEVSGGDYSNNEADYGGVFYTYLTSSSAYLLVDTTTFSGNVANVTASGVRYFDGSSYAAYTLASPTSFTCRGFSGCY